MAAFCILGGIFGEGIDLPGERLTSVVIVGVGLPQFNRETEQLRAWFQQQCGAGFEYAYLYPGMQKVDQALGRVIRGSAGPGPGPAGGQSLRRAPVPGPVTALVALPALARGLS